MFCEIEAAANPAQQEQQFGAEYDPLSAWFLVAEGIAIENLADPRETRHYLSSFPRARPLRLSA